MKTFLTMIMLFWAFITFSQPQTFYVSLKGDDSNPGTEKLPFQTLQKALDESIGIEVENIFILGGVYELKAPLLINARHTGTGNSVLRIRNFGNEKVTLSGGKKLEGWQKQKNGWWVCDIPEVKSGDWKFRQIYVNGDLRHRARKPNSGFLRVKGMPEGTPKTVNYHTDCQSFEFAEGDINPKWRNLDDVEVIVYHFWTDSHLPIQSIDKKSNIVTFKHKAGKTFTDDFSEDGARYIVENVFEELDAPGEWYLDKKEGKCYYFPFPDEKINQTEIVAPVIEKLIVFEGKPEKGEFITNLKFQNLEFCYTNWDLPPGNSNDEQGSASVPAAVSLSGVQYCTFDHCGFKNLGTWAVEINKGCSNNTFSFNEIGNIAAGGFRVKGGDYNEHIFFRTSKNRIVNNHIHHFGEVYPSAVGVLLQRTEGNLVSQNHIHHGYYTGISIGWEWGYQRSISRDNIIEHNHIHHIGQGLLSDMGAIYTLGVSPGTVIRNNLIHDVDANHYGGWGIYLDEGSTHILVENNIVYNTKFAAFNMHFAKEVTVRNNIFALGRMQQLNRTRMEPHKSVYFEQNIVYWKEGKLLDGQWTDKPYEFYFHPKNDSGTREVKETFDMDYNLWYNPEQQLDSLKWAGFSWEEWQESGKDVHSVFANPMFINPEDFDFRLMENSPAFKLGFQGIEIRKALKAGENAGTDY